MKSLSPKKNYRIWIFALIIGILFFSIVSFDTEHIDQCNSRNHCFLCSTIILAQKVFLAVISFGVIAIMLSTIVTIIQAETYKIKNRKVIICYSLVARKTRFNE